MMYVLRITPILKLNEGKNANNVNVKVIFKNCAPFTDCISKINNAQLDNAEDFHIIMPIHNLIEYSDNYLKISKRLWQYYRDETAVNVANIVQFNATFPTTDLYNMTNR